MGPQPSVAVARGALPPPSTVTDVGSGFRDGLEPFSPWSLGVGFGGGCRPREKETRQTRHMVNAMRGTHVADPVSSNSPKYRRWQLNSYNMRLSCKSECP